MWQLHEILTRVGPLVRDHIPTADIPMRRRFWLTISYRWVVVRCKKKRVQIVSVLNISLWHLKIWDPWKEFNNEEMESNVKMKSREQDIRAMVCDVRGSPGWLGLCFPESWEGGTLVLAWVCGSVCGLAKLHSELYYLKEALVHLGDLDWHINWICKVQKWSRGYEEKNRKRDKICIKTKYLGKKITTKQIQRF